MSLSLAKMEALAPDQGSLDAARKLLKPAIWPKLATDGSGLLWGECQGSGATPYRVVVAEADAGYKCTCPSRKFPCKHSLALMWLRVDGKSTFSASDTPDWVKEWVARRRGPGGAAASSEGASAKTSISLAAAAVEETVDPKAEARAAAARERNRQEREASIRAGLDELDLWLEDQVDRGMAEFVAHSSAACRVIAQRLVDAKASGLAGRLDGLAARLFSLPEAMRPIAAVEELGQLHLLAEAYRRQEELSPNLRADVRQTIGWTISREALLADTFAERIGGRWRVVAVQSEVQPDRLRRIETWLMLEGVSTEGKARFAVLLDFVPVATGASASGYAVGEALDAELVFYPSAYPLRALLVRSAGSAISSAPLALPPGTLGDGFAQYEAALIAQPWANACPITFQDARVRRSGGLLFVCDASDNRHSMPLHPSQVELASPLASLQKIDGLGLWDGRHLTLCWAETELGRWVAA
jgi:hypothetical protein